MSFEIPTELIDLYEEGIDAIIAKFGKSCRLFYPSARNQCPNCVLDTFSGVSSNRYKSGGPTPFTDGICPYCNGVGYVNEEVWEDIRMIVHWMPKDWLKIGRLVIPDGGIQTRGYMTQYPKLQQCIKLRIQDLNGYGTFDFEKNEAPVPWGLRLKWVITNWKRV